MGICESLTAVVSMASLGRASSGPQEAERWYEALPSAVNRAFLRLRLFVLKACVSVCVVTAALKIQMCVGWQG